MVRLKDRTRQIPNGFRYIQPETGFEPQQWSSFDSLCRQVLTHRQGNPWLAQKHQWALTMEAIANEADYYNAKVCQAHGWTAFIVEDNASPPDFPKASLPHQSEASVAAEPSGVGKVAKAVAGLKLITDWLGSGLKPVERTLAESRAKICEKCPKNKLGDFWQRLEGAAAAELRTLLEVKNDLELSLPNEDKLHSCQVCDCWMPLKCWTPIKHILENTTPEVFGALHKKCWIPKE